jgi:hypothetical protein
MRTCRKFKHFDPLTGEVPYWPFPELSSVAWRARRILTGQSSDQIHDLANHIHDLIAEYFARPGKTRCAGSPAGLEEFLEVGAHGGILGINLDRIDELDFPKPENTSELDALEASIGVGRRSSGKENAVPDLGECLATLALCQVGDAVHRLQYEYDFDRFKYVRRKAKRLTAHDCIVAGQCALEALEVVCRAELSIETGRLQERFAEHIDAVRRQTSAEVQSAQPMSSAPRKTSS